MKEFISFIDFTNMSEEEKYKLLNSKDYEIERLNNIINDIKEYVNFLFIFNQIINGKFSETIWGQEILSFIEDSDK